MEFKNTINTIGESNIPDKLKVQKVIEFISDKYSENSRPVYASKAKKQLLNNNQISKEEAAEIKFPEITANLFKLAEKRLNEQEVIEISEEVYNKLLEYKKSKLPEELIIYLLLTSGLRFNEIYKGNFSIKNGNLIIDKLSKRKQDGMKDFIINLILIKPKQFIKLLNIFRKNNQLNQNALNRKVNRRLNKFNLTAHKMRSIYLYYHLNIKKTQANKSIHTAVQNLLHHQRADTGKYYQNKFVIAGLEEKRYNTMTNKELREELNKKGINKNNTKGFNKLNKKQLLDLLK